jgi:hypothetical protein
MTEDTGERVAEQLQDRLDAAEVILIGGGMGAKVSGLRRPDGRVQREGVVR